MVFVCCFASWKKNCILISGSAWGDNGIWVRNMALSFSYWISIVSFQEIVDSSVSRQRMEMTQVIKVKASNATEGLEKLMALCLLRKYGYIWVAWTQLYPHYIQLFTNEPIHQQDELWLVALHHFCLWAAILTRFMLIVKGLATWLHNDVKTEICWIWAYLKIFLSPTSFVQ